MLSQLWWDQVSWGGACFHQQQEGWCQGGTAGWPLMTQQLESATLSAAVLFLDGEVYTWGKSARGRLGRKEEATQSPRPVQLDEPHPYLVTSVSCCHGNTLLAVKRECLGPGGGM